MFSKMHHVVWQPKWLQGWFAAVWNQVTCVGIKVIIWKRFRSCCLMTGPSSRIAYALQNSCSDFPSVTSLALEVKRRIIHRRHLKYGGISRFYVCEGALAGGI